MKSRAWSWSSRLPRSSAREPLHEPITPPREKRRRRKVDRRLLRSVFLGLDDAAALRVRSFAGTGRIVHGDGQPAVSVKVVGERHGREERVAHAPALAVRASSAAPMRDLDPGREPCGGTSRTFCADAGRVGALTRCAVRQFCGPTHRGSLLPQAAIVRRATTLSPCASDRRCGVAFVVGQVCLARVRGFVDERQALHRGRSANLRETLGVGELVGTETRTTPKP